MIPYIGKGQPYAFEDGIKECLSQKPKAACSIGSINTYSQYLQKHILGLLSPVCILPVILMTCCN